MELGVQNLDNFKDFFFNQSIEIDIFSFLISLLLSAILALLVKYVYLKCAMTLSNKSYFSDLFVPLSITTTLVITVIKFSLALSLGLVGALSIVRFRAAIKEPEELVYLFFIISIGLANGANQFLLSTISTLIIIFFLFLRNFYQSKKSKETETIDGSADEMVENTVHLLIHHMSDNDTEPLQITVSGQLKIRSSSTNVKKVSDAGV